MAIMARTKGVTALEFEGDRYDMGSKAGFLKANVVKGLENEETKEEFREFLKSLIGTL
jgi:UTP--glucose-1-phosphate uridylyltransferase